MNNRGFTPATDEKDMRDAYCDALISAAETNGRVVAIDCDLSSSMGTARYKKRFPERYFNLGIMEANACSMAAGLSVTGFVPFVHSFAVFSSRRMAGSDFPLLRLRGIEREDRRRGRGRERGGQRRNAHGV